MTEFFSNFGKKISNVGQETVKKTKEIAEIGKISSKIKDEEKKLDGLYTELGKKYFSSYPPWITTHFADTLMIYRLKYYIRNKNLQG